MLAASLLAGQVHKSPMPGKWYPADAPALNKLLDQSFSAAGKRTGSAPRREKLRALVAPHAALPYSGVIAASAYRLLDGPRNVIVLGFSHRRPLRGVIAPAVDAYLTPLGEIKVNREAVKQLQFGQMSEDQLCDHSLENQLPFLQRAAPSAGLIPLYVGELTGDELRLAAQRLARQMEQGDVVIASSDFTHYGEAYRYTPFPNDKELPRKLFQRAMVTFELIGSLDVAEFDGFIAATQDNLCGRYPVRLLMAAVARLKADTYLKALDYMASGELTRDYSLSVGYGALAFYPSSAFGVGEQDQKRLLTSARQTLDKYLASGKKERVPPPVAERGPDLKQRAGVFVTVKKGGELRGCIGSVFARKPLYEAVVDSTLAAASADPRFPPVTAKDGPLSLEISLLTPLKRINDWREFRIGQGAFLVLNGKSGLILPQVAAEKGWDRKQFLENLSRKAGLHPNAYQDRKASLYVYSAQVFRETAPEPRSADTPNT
jgi:AmmeMemoRadiSam system protein B/AmmeMemoRadiSam system protein A